MSKRKSGPSPLPVPPQGEQPEHHNDGSGPKPLAVGKPTISGQLKANEILTAVEGLISNAIGNTTEVFVWRVGGIIRQTGESPLFSTTADDFGLPVTVTHQVTDSAGRTAEAVSDPTNPIAGTNPMVGRPVISGFPYPTRTVTATPGFVEGVPTPLSTFDWYLGGVLVLANSTTYVIPADALEKSLILRHTVSSVAGTVFADSTASTIVLDPNVGLVNLTPPYVFGTPTENEILGINSGTWNPVPQVFAYAWYRGNTLITNATGPSYTLTAADVGFAIKGETTATYQEYVQVIQTAPTALVGTAAPPNFAPAFTTVPHINGVALVGQTLTGDVGQVTGTPAPTFAYRWLANNVAITGATGLTYVLTADEAGKTIRFEVVATNSEGSATGLSVATAAVAFATQQGFFGLYSNIGGMETGSAWAGFTIRIPNATIDSQVAKGIKKFRVTLDGSKAQPELFGPLNLEYMNFIKNDVVDYCASKGATAVIDLHDFGQRSVQTTVNTAVATETIFNTTGWTAFQATLTPAGDGVIEGTANNWHTLYKTYNVGAGRQTIKVRVANGTKPWMRLIARVTGTDYAVVVDLTNSTAMFNSGQAGLVLSATSIGGGVTEITMVTPVIAAGTLQLIFEPGVAAASYSAYTTTSRIYVGDGVSQPFSVKYVELNTGTDVQKGLTYGSAELPNSAAADWWFKVTQWLLANCNVAGIEAMEGMNEPFQWSTDQCFNYHKEVIPAIRAAGWTGAYYVGGIPWQNGPTFWSLNPNLHLLRQFDPADNLIYSAHGYPDRDSSGYHFGPEEWGQPRAEGPPGAVTDVNVLIDRYRPFIEGCEARGVRASVGECGIDFTGGPTSIACMQATIAYMQAHKCHWYVWATGPVWGPTYPYSLEDRPNGQQSPGMVIFDDFYGNPAPTKFGIEGPSSISPVETATVTITYNGRLTANESITLSDNGGGGSFTPPVVVLPPGPNAIGTSVYTPNGERIVKITATSASGWTEVNGGFYLSSEDDSFSLANVDFSLCENAISLNRQLVNTYLGPLFTAYRDSDGTTLDVFPVGQAVNQPNVGKEVDIAALLDVWGSGTVVRLFRAYDQSPGSEGLAANSRHDVTTAIQRGRTPVPTEYPILQRNARYGFLEAAHSNTTRMRLLSRLGVTGHAMIAKWRLTSGTRFIAWEHTYSFSTIGAGINLSHTANAGANGANAVPNDRGNFGLGVRNGEEHVYAYRWRCAASATSERIGGWKSWRDASVHSVQNSQMTKWNVDFGANDACMGWFINGGVDFTGAWSELIIFRDGSTGGVAIIPDDQIEALQHDLMGYYDCNSPGMDKPWLDFNFKTADYKVGGTPVTLTNYMTGVVRDATGAEMTTSTTIAAVGALLSVLQSKKFLIHFEIHGIAPSLSGSGNHYDFVRATHSGGVYTMGKLAGTAGRMQMTNVSIGGGHSWRGTEIYNFAINDDQKMVMAYDGGIYPASPDPVLTKPWPNALTAVQLLKCYQNQGLKCVSIKVWDITERDHFETLRRVHTYGGIERNGDMSSGYYMGPNWGEIFNVPTHTYTDAFDGAMMDYFKGYGCNASRTVLRRTVYSGTTQLAWGRREAGELPSARYINEIRKHVDKCLAIGIEVMLDWHTFGNINKPSTTDGLSYTPAMWKQDLLDLVAAMPSSPKIWLELANEPDNVYVTPGGAMVTPAQWADMNIDVLVALRAAGFIGPVVVSGYGDFGATSLIQPQGDDLIRIIDADPLNNVVISGHDYFQTSNYDANPNAVAYSNGVGALYSATMWARKMRSTTGKKIRLLLGEGGMSNSVANGDNQREWQERAWYISNNRDVWMAHFVFGAGGFATSPEYAFQFQPLYFTQPTKGERSTIGLMSQFAVPTDLVLTPPVNNILPTLSGSNIQGQVLSVASNGVWDRAISFAYIWQRDGVTIVPNVTTNTYLLDIADVGHKVSCRVTATNPYGSSSVSTALSGSIQPAGAPSVPQFTTLPSIVGAPLVVGTVITLSDGVISGFPTPTLTRQWYRNGAAITGETGSTYTLTTTDNGKQLTAKVSATNSQGTAVGTSNTLSVPDPNPSTVSFTLSNETNVSALVGDLTNTYEYNMAADPTDPNRQLLVSRYGPGTVTNTSVIRFTTDNWVSSSNVVLTGETEPTPWCDSLGNFYIGMSRESPADYHVRKIPAGSGTLGPAVFVGNYVDRPHLHVDCSSASPFEGRIYCGGRMSGGLRIYRSDNGTTWTSTLIGSDANFNNGFLYGITTGRDGTVYATYSSRNNIINTNGAYAGSNQDHFCVKSTDGGVTWSIVFIYKNQETVSTGNGVGYRSWAGQIAVNPITDRLHVLLSQGGSTIAQKQYLISDDKGETWVDKGPLNLGLPSGWGPGHHSLHCNDQGELCVMFYATNSSYSSNRYYVLGSKDDGVSWGGLTQVNTTDSPTATGQRGIIGEDRNYGCVTADSSFACTWESHLTADNVYAMRTRRATMGGAPTYYFSTTGNNANNGLSAATPKQTMAALKTLVASAQPGTVFKFKRGDTFANTTDSIYVGQPGLTFDSYGTGVATITTPQTIDLFYVAANDITIQNLKFTGTGYADAGNTASGVFWADDGVVQTLKNLRVNNVECSGLKFGILAGLDTPGAKFDGFTVENCYVHDVRAGGIGTYGYEGTGTTVASRRQEILNVKVRNCVVRDCGTEGIVIAFTTNPLIEYCVASTVGKLISGCVGIWFYDVIGGLIQYCESYDNRSNGSLTAGPDGDGFDLDRAAENCTIQYCYSHGNAGAGILVYGSENTSNKGNVVRFNVSENDAVNTAGYGSIHVAAQGVAMGDTQVYGNTVYNSVAGSACLRIDGHARGRFTNNIFHASGTCRLYVLEIDAVENASLNMTGNFWYHASAPVFRRNNGATNYSSLAAYQAVATTFEKIGGTNVGLITNPGLTSAGTGGTMNATSVANVTTWLPATLTGYKLAGGAAALGAGRNLLTEFGITPPSLDFYGQTYAGNVGAD